MIPNKKKVGKQIVILDSSTAPTFIDRIIVSEYTHYFSGSEFNYFS